MENSGISMKTVTKKTPGRISISQAYFPNLLFAIAASLRFTRMFGKQP